MASELRWDLNHRLVNKHGHWVQITSIRLKPKTLSLKWKRSAASDSESLKNFPPTFLLSAAAGYLLLRMLGEPTARGAPAADPQAQKA